MKLTSVSTSVMGIAAAALGIASMVAMAPVNAAEFLSGRKPMLVRCIILRIPLRGLVRAWVTLAGLVPCGNLISYPCKMPLSTCLL